MAFRFFGSSNWRIELRKGSKGRTRWYVLDQTDNIRGQSLVNGWPTVEEAEGDALEYLDGIGAPRIPITVVTTD